MLVVALVAASLLFPAALASETRHLGQIPENLLKKALALEAVVSWLHSCLARDVREEVSRAGLEGINEVLRTMADEVLRGTVPGVLFLGGLQLKAFKLLISGSEDISGEDLRNVVEYSIKSLVDFGVPPSLIERVSKDTSPRTAIVLAIYVNKITGASRCSESVLLETLRFTLYIEKGDIMRARNIAEEVLGGDSIFFGIIMLNILEKMSGAYCMYVKDISVPSDEILEELLKKLRELDIELSEVLNRYSLSELIELYESLGDITVVDVLSKANLTTLSQLRSDEDASYISLDEDVIRYSIISNTSYASHTIHSSENISEGSIDIVRCFTEAIPPQIIEQSITAISRVSYTQRYHTEQKQARPPTYTNPATSSQNTDLLGLFLVVLASVALSIASASLVRRGYDRTSLPGAVRLTEAMHTSMRRGPATELFWSVVRSLIERTGVEVSRSDTHREIVRKFELKLDGITSAALWRLCRLYEVERFSRAAPGEVIASGLRKLRRVLEGRDGDVS